MNVLTDKCMDLEGRSRRQNVLIARLKEGTEQGKEMNTFVSELLKEVLSMDENPLVDRAHRVLRRRPNDTDPPRSIIVRRDNHPQESCRTTGPNLQWPKDPYISGFYS